MKLKDKLVDDPFNIVMAVNQVSKIVDDIIKSRDTISGVSFVNNQKELIITIIFDILSEPRNKVGNELMRSLIKTWVSRGGKCVVTTILSEALKDKSTFYHACEYLYDYGLTIREISEALCSGYVNVNKALREIGYIGKSDEY